jgi:three-Cys-motif partner protein
MSATDDFFKGKRSWSRIKDQVLKNYMTPYLMKVRRLGRKILLIDGYAGPGVFEDGTEGSPLLICEAAQKCVPSNYQAIFVNKSRKDHRNLSNVLTSGGWMPPATPVLGDTRQVLYVLPERLTDETVFLYLDPFGPTGCEFSLLEPFLKRDHVNASTEIVLTMSMPGLPRFAGRKKVQAGRWNEKLTEGFHNRLTRIMGGDYWKEILWAEGVTPEEREWQLIEAYSDRLRRYLPYVGYCPVRDADSRIKYFIVFASRHPDAMVLMNDFMAKAYYEHIHRQVVQGGLFADTDWRDMRGLHGLTNDLDRVVLDAVLTRPGETRQKLWEFIVIEHFMQYTHPEYVKLVQQLVDTGRLSCPTPRSTKKLNHNCRLNPTGGGTYPT